MFCDSLFKALPFFLQFEMFMAKQDQTIAMEKAASVYSSAKTQLFLNVLRSWNIAEGAPRTADAPPDGSREKRPVNT